MTKPYLLWLIWQNVNTRQRYHVGNLLHVDGLYVFQYETENKHRGLKEALDNGYRPHLAFPDLKKVYTSDKMFGPFLRRLPNASRPDFPKLLEKYGLPKDYTQMDLLRATGGRLGTDSYEFVHPVYIEGNHFDFDFHIAGWRYYDGDKHLGEISYDTKLSLEKEPSNDNDSFAVKVQTNNGLLLGYVPAFFSEFMTHIIDEGCYYEVRIEKIDVHAIPQLRVCLTVNGEFDTYFDDISRTSKDLVPVQVV
ncbi:HIRAN domain-containing protein [Priestia megaterium]|uniref:HIRAN domain-containing protein n=1 Tax=Priestia megaterium TaxID=1404 RepID=UPI00211D70DC|nr:HIRAN domain-containing protein [Priestia megaterium]